MKKRVIIVILLVIAVLCTLAAIAWFAIAPGIVRSKLHDACATVEQKTGRHIEVKNIDLKGFKHIRFDAISISQKDDPDSVAFELNNLELRLANIPGLGKIQLEAVHADDVTIHYNTNNEHSSLSELLSSFNSNAKHDDEGSAGDEKQPAWKSYITPLPDVSFGAINIDMAPMKLNESITIVSASAENASVRFNYDTQGKRTAIFSSELHATIKENGKSTEYTSKAQGYFANAKEGTFEFSIPKSTSGELPPVLKYGNYEANADKLIFELPTTIRLEKPVLKHNDDTLFIADETRVQFMAIPPKKVSGVYIKEFELKTPIIEASIYDESNDLKDLITVLKSMTAAQTASGADADDFKTNKKPLINGDATDEQKAEINQPKPSPEKKAKNPRDYYFAQRFFVSDAQITIHDKRKSSNGDLKINNLSLESGYRGIRKIVDLDVHIATSAPFLMNAKVSGYYDLASNDISAQFDLDQLGISEDMRAVQQTLREKIQKPDAPKPQPSAALRALKNAPAPAHLKRAGSSKYNVSATDSQEDAPKYVPSKTEKLFAALEFERDANLETHFKLDGNVDKKSVNITSNTDLTGLSIFARTLSSENVSLDSKIDLDATLSWDSNPALELNNLTVSRDGVSLITKGSFSREIVTPTKTSKNPNPESEVVWNYDFSAEVPTVLAQKFYEAVPHAFRTELDGMTALGQIGINFTAKGKSNNISETQHKFDLITSDDFMITGWPKDRNINKLNNGFTYHVEDPRAISQHTIAVPPSVYPIIKRSRQAQADIELYTPSMTPDDVRVRFSDWVVFEDLNPWLVQLITTTEDGSFFTHEGFSAMQVKAALARNIREGEFSRGASTISMQLVKNIFFNRNKTLSRKAQEALYTWLMESVIKIPKQRIMELYFNIIEFGPEIYGVEAASEYYFGKRSDALTLNEAAFLISIIPGPRRGERYRSNGITPNLKKNVDFYIREMYRRKCDPETISRMHARFAKKNQKPPFEPCCPTAAEVELMQQQEIKFYIPDPNDPTLYGLNPELYLHNGTPIYPVHRSCGYNAAATISDNAEAATEALSAIFSETN